MKEILHKNTRELETEARNAAIETRKILKYIILIGFFGLFTAGGLYWFGWPEYLQWRQRRTLAEAAHFEANGDLRRALLLLEQAYQVYPKNLEARRRLAAFWERLGQRQGLDEWRKIALLEPTDPQNQLGLAAAALRFGEIETARNALKQAGAAGADYYRLRAGLAVAERDSQALEAALAELARLRPDDPRALLNLAIARLPSPDPERSAAGRAALVKLAAGREVRLRAVAELLNDLSRRWPRPSPERLEAFQRLAQSLTPPVGPRADSPERGDPVERLLAHAMRQTDPLPEDAGLLMAWMILNGRVVAAFQWWETLPAVVRDNPQTMAQPAEAAVQIADWRHLRELLLAGAWGPVSAAVIDEAFAARENRGRWAAALEAAQPSLPALRLLLRLATVWKWEEEQRQVLTAVTRDFAAETWAWRRLVAQALARRDTSQLWDTYLRWSRAAPGDLAVQTEAAILGLLLQKREAPGVEEAAALWQREPANPGAVVMQALAFWRAHRPQEALQQLATLPPSAWDEPRYALAHGLILADAGRARESEQMLNRATAERLLPDEMLLVEQARARNRLRRPADGR